MLTPAMSSIPASMFRLSLLLSLLTFCLLMTWSLSSGGRRHRGSSENAKSNAKQIFRHAFNDSVWKLLIQRPELSFLSSLSTNSSSSDCPLVPPILLTSRLPAAAFVHDDTRPTWQDLSRLYADVTGGGSSPQWCRQSQRLAVLVAYRNRESHLRRLLLHLHWLLPLQACHYKIFVVEQAGRQVFNRGEVFNVGFKEAVKTFNATCVVLHDVDMVPEEPLNLYRCGSSARLLSSALNKFNYKMPYDGYFGGTVAVAAEHFVKINGFSNKFWGWGGEDDNLKHRLHWSGIRTLPTPLKLGRFSMVKHTLDKGNEVNPKRLQLIAKNSKVWRSDGLNSVSYRLLLSVNLPLFHLIRVELAGPRMASSTQYSLMDCGVVAKLLNRGGGNQTLS